MSFLSTPDATAQLHTSLCFTHANPAHMATPANSQILRQVLMLCKTQQGNADTHAHVVLSWQYLNLYPTVANLTCLTRIVWKKMVICKPQCLRDVGQKKRTEEPELIRLQLCHSLCCTHAHSALPVSLLPSASPKFAAGHCSLRLV